MAYAVFNFLPVLFVDQKPAHQRYHAKPFLGSSHSWAFSVLDTLAPSSKVLDIGSGSGVAGSYLKQRGITELYAVEKDPRAREATAQIYKLSTDSLDSLSSNRFDAILLLDLLEHLDDPFGFLAQVVSLLNPKGRVLISVPNITHWSVRLSVLFGRFRYAERGILDGTHLHFFDAKHFSKLLNSTALRVVQRSASIEPAEFVLPKFIWDNPIFRAASAVRLALAKALPGLFAYQFLAELRKD